MNKLTEIKEAKEEYEAKGFMPHIESVGEIERVSCEFHNKAYDRISYLISLLEEKDKALEFYADKESYKGVFQPTGFQVYIKPVETDGGEIARKALNTSQGGE